MNCPVCGVDSKERCGMVEPPFPRDCLRVSRPPALKTKGDNIENVWEGPGVAQLVGVVDQIRKIQRSAAA